MKIEHGNLWDYWERGWYVGITTNCTTVRYAPPSRCTALVMGAGLALEAKKRWHELPQEWGAREPLEGVIVDVEKGLVRCPTKRHWKDPSPVDLIKNTVQGLKEFLEEEGRRGNEIRLALPPLGCGLGGRNWEGEILPLMRGLPDNVVVVLKGR